MKIKRKYLVIIGLLLIAMFIFFRWYVDKIGCIESRLHIKIRSMVEETGGTVETGYLGLPIMQLKTKIKKECEDDFINVLSEKFIEPKNMSGSIEPLYYGRNEIYEELTNEIKDSVIKHYFQAEIPIFTIKTTVHIYVTIQDGDVIAYFFD